MKRVILISLLMVLVSCRTYPHRVFEENTGIELSRSTNLCPGGAVQNGRTCEPQGPNWVRGSNIGLAQLEIGNNVFERVDNEYLLQGLRDWERYRIHNFNLYQHPLNNPKHSITLNGARAGGARESGFDLVPEIAIKVEVATIFEETAVTEALLTLEAEAEAQNQELPASFLAGVESELKEEIKNTVNSQLRFYYVTAQYRGDLAAGLTDSLLIDGLKPVADMHASGAEVMTGISGFLFVNFRSDQNIFESSMLRNAIEASLTAASSSDEDAIRQIGVSASANWSREINREISATLNTSLTGAYFIPLWFKSV